MAQRDIGKDKEAAYHTLEQMTPEERYFHELLIADIERFSELIRG